MNVLLSVLRSVEAAVLIITKSGRMIYDSMAGDPRQFETAIAKQMEIMI
ncbi:MAG: hypothetical protein V8R55_02250 [Dysosmobacter sp.]